MSPARANADTPAAVWWVLLGLTVIAAGLRAFHLSYAPFWTDEYATYVFATEPLPRLLGPEYRVETNPPLYYLLQRVWLWFGDRPEIMRALPVSFGVLAVPLTYLAGRRLVGIGAALIGASLVATSDIHIHFSREVRGYTLLTAAALGALACLSELLLGSPIERRDRLLWLGYVTCTVLGLYTHSTAILLPVLSSLLLFSLFVTRRIDKALLIQGIVAHLTIAVLFAPRVLVTFLQARQQLTAFWVPASTPGWVYGQLLGAYPFPKWSKPLFLGLFGWGAWALRRKPVALAFVMCFVIGQPLLIYLASLIHPVFLTRVLVWPTALAFLAMGKALCSLRPRLGVPGSILASAIASAVQLGTLRANISARPESSPIAAFARPLRDFQPARDRLVVAPLEFAWPLWYEARALGLARRGLGITYADRALQLEGWYGLRHVQRADLVSQLGATQRVWLLIERTSRFSHERADGFVQSLAAVQAWGETLQHWRSGPVELLLVERR